MVPGTMQDLLHAATQKPTAMAMRWGRSCLDLIHRLGTKEQTNYIQDQHNYTINFCSTRLYLQNYFTFSVLQGSFSTDPFDGALLILACSPLHSYKHY